MSSDQSTFSGYVARPGMETRIMARTKVSSKYQVVIPKEVRTHMKIRPGQQFQVIAKGGLITLVPDRPVSEMRGFVRGIRTTGFREKKDRL
jgi:AbrB family looped-hinge helix DNA binding protein